MSKKTRFSLGEKIKKARHIAGLSQKQLAKGLHLSDKAISAYEVGRAEPSIEVLKKISVLTHTTVQYFTDDGNEEALDIQAKLRRIEQELIEIKKIVAKKNID